MVQFIHSIANHFRFLDFEDTNETFWDGCKVKAVILPVCFAVIVIDVLYLAEPVNFGEGVKSEFIRGFYYLSVDVLNVRIICGVQVAGKYYLSDLTW